MKEKLKIIKTKSKEIFNHIFIDGLSGMAWGLFSTLIIGLIIEQIGKLVGDNQIGNMLIIIGKVCSALTGAGMGTSGFVGQFMTWQTMIETENGVILLIKIALLHFILPAIIAGVTSYFMRKKGILKDGDMKLEL